MTQPAAISTFLLYTSVQLLTCLGEPHSFRALSMAMPIQPFHTASEIGIWALHPLTLNRTEETVNIWLCVTVLERLRCGDTAGATPGLCPYMISSSSEQIVWAKLDCNRMRHDVAVQTKIDWFLATWNQRISRLMSSDMDEFGNYDITIVGCSMKSVPCWVMYDITW